MHLNSYIILIWWYLNFDEVLVLVLRPWVLVVVLWLWVLVLKH